MGCPKGGSHSYINEEGRPTCQKCGHIARFSFAPTYEKLVADNSLLRKMLEDICECRGNLDELIDKARKLLKEIV